MDSPPLYSLNRTPHPQSSPTPLPPRSSPIPVPLYSPISVSFSLHTPPSFPHSSAAPTSPKAFSFLSSLPFSTISVQHLISCIQVHGPATPFRLSSTPFSPSSVSPLLSPKTHLAQAISQLPDVSMCPSSFTS